MVNFIARQDALRIQKAHLLYIYGQPKGEDTDKVDKNIVKIGKDKDKEIYKRKDEDELKDVELEVIEDKVVEDQRDVEEGVNNEHTEGESNTHYPAPVVAIAKTPTRSNALVWDLIESYRATELISALSHYLVTRCHVPEDQAIISLHHILPVWHQFSLQHLRLSFGPRKPSKQDVVHTQLAQPN
ncbi:hypothetical protein FRC07_000165 [Ceratobasidium sp. 392]|nr:hypothetical protein FRC07_000165 [Ceratobasidium sp. 392]